MFYERNARTHSDDQIEQIVQSIQEFGFTNPVLIDENNVLIAGHGRTCAARTMGMTEVPAIRLTGLSEAQQKALRIADNQLALNAGWDEELLKIELSELQDVDFNLDLLGFDMSELDDILQGLGLEPEPEQQREVEEDEPPTTNVQARCKRGDIWQLGKHRLMCGDSTNKETVAMLMGGAKADMVFTDPPYGMNAVSKSGVLSKKYKTDILNDDNNQVAIDSYNLAQSMFGNTKQVWWGANYYTECLPSAECWIVWDKNNGASDQTDCELAWTNFRSVVRQFTLASEKINRVHPTQKPIALIQQIFNRFDKGLNFQTIVDLFGGSGSTLIACEQLNRQCYMMELDEHYCDVIIQRWEDYTGNTAKIITPATCAS